MSELDGIIQICPAPPGWVVAFADVDEESHMLRTWHVDPVVALGVSVEDGRGMAVFLVSEKGFAGLIIGLTDPSDATNFVGAFEPSTDQHEVIAKAVKEWASRQEPG